MDQLPVRRTDLTPTRPRRGARESAVAAASPPDALAGSLIAAESRLVVRGAGAASIWL